MALKLDDTTTRNMEILQLSVKKEINRLYKRSSALADRVAVLESSLTKTQELVRQDMNRLIEMIGREQ